MRFVFGGVLGLLTAMITSCGQLAREPEMDIEKYVEEVRASRGGAKLVVDEEEHDFGTVWAGDQLCHTFKIKNIGGEPAHVKFIGSSPIWNAHFDIEPGKVYPHEVCLNSRKYFGPFEKAFTVILMSQSYER